MNLIKIICTGFLALVFSGLSAQENPLWMRYPAISPDGKTIAFCYKGDIFLVSSEGGRATQLTTHPAYDSRPVWSPDGKTIAFTSARDEGLNLYTVPVSGGQRMERGKDGRIYSSQVRKKVYLFRADRALEEIV